MRRRRRNGPPPFENLKAWCDSWLTLKEEPCCQHADEETVESDCEEFDCETCPVYEALQALWPENLEAWTLFHRLACRVSADYQMTSPVLAAVLRERDAEESLDLLDRFATIYDLVYPPPPKKPDA